MKKVLKAIDVDEDGACVIWLCCVEDVCEWGLGKVWEDSLPGRRNHGGRSNRGRCGGGVTIRQSVSSDCGCNIAWAGERIVLWLQRDAG